VQGVVAEHLSGQQGLLAPLHHHAQAGLIHGWQPLRGCARAEQLQRRYRRVVQAVGGRELGNQVNELRLAHIGGRNFGREQQIVVRHSVGARKS